MFTLYHFPLHPGSRMIRLFLKEKGIEVVLSEERHWERRSAFLALNPSGELPVLGLPDGGHLAEMLPIADYLEALVPMPALIGESPLARAEILRLTLWFERKFQREVTANLVEEKIGRRLMGRGHPDSNAIRAGTANIHTHLDYIGWLADRRAWLGGDHFSLADIAAAAQLSTVDYIGDVPWDAHQGARDWYARVKSRPSFRPILGDHLPGAPPPRHYADLDF